MTTKTIMVMAITATLILGTFSMSSAFAVEPGDQITVESKGSVSCQINGDGCGNGKIKTMASFLVFEGEDGQFTGFGNLQSSVKIPGVGNLRIISDGLPFAYVPNGAHMEAQGDVIGKKGVTGQINLIITNMDFANETGECSTTLMISGGPTFVQPPTQCGVILSPIST